MLVEETRRTSSVTCNGIWIVEGNEKKVEKDRASATGFETGCDEAIASTGYGLFNILMLLAALPVAWTCVLDTTITAFFIQSIECDLDLTLARRGIAVGIIYIGMIVAGPLWDFILQDCFIGYWGKRNVMIMGLLLDSICNISWAQTNSYYSFLVFKFLNGIIIAGPLSVLMPYLSEFHAPTYQPSFTRWSNLLFAVSNIFPPALASVTILQTSWLNITIFDRLFETWRVYMLICATPPVLGILTVGLMPKSPKFLVTQGQSHKAMRILETMYRLNKFESSGRFKVKSLTPQEKKKHNIRNICTNKLKDSVSKLRTLCSKPHLRTFLLILALQFTSMLGFNTMRLWLPQLFITLNNFRVYTRSYYPLEHKITMCEMLFPTIEKIDYASCNYTLPDVESAVYVNSTIITSSAVFLSFFFTLLANTRMKKIVAIMLSFVVSTIGSFGANWAGGIPHILLFCTFIIITSRTAGNIILTYSNQEMSPLLWPISFNCINLIGNIGAAFGSIVFPMMLGVDCLTAIMSVGCFTLVSYFLSFLLIHKSTEGTEPSIERF